MTKLEILQSYFPLISIGFSYLISFRHMDKIWWKSVNRPMISLTLKPSLWISLTINSKGHLSRRWYESRMIQWLMKHCSQSTTEIVIKNLGANGVVSHNNPPGRLQTKFRQEEFRGPHITAEMSHNKNVTGSWVSSNSGLIRTWKPKQPEQLPMLD
jgi:hypothetical protein